jgi:hypothetical protein
MEAFFAILDKKFKKNSAVLIFGHQTLNPFPDPDSLELKCWIRIHNTEKKECSLL